MTSALIQPLLDAINHNVLFGGLIGCESMYVLTRVHQNRSPLLWALLLPLLLAVSLVDYSLAMFLRMVSCTFLLPLCVTLVAAAAATLITAVHKQYNRRTHEKQAGLLFFVSMTALCIAVAFWHTSGPTVATSLQSALSLWAGYGIGLACFASIGVKLNAFMTTSRYAGMALFYLTLSLIGLFMAGLAGLTIR
jgi:hypothetical protein